MAETAFLIQISTYKIILRLTLLFLFFIVSLVPTLTVAQIVYLTAAGVVNTGVLTAFDIDPDVLTDADKFGLDSL